jgi:hypothetical protein
MRTAKVIFISEEEKSMIDRLKKAYMATDSGKKKNARIGVVLTEMWYEDSLSFEDFQIDEIDWNMIDDILTAYEDEPLRDNEGYIFDKEDMLDALADFDPLADSKIYHDYKIMIM